MEEQLARPWLDRTIEEGATTVTVACVSALTNEEGGMIVTPKTTLDDVVKEYARQFPRESAAYLLKIKNETDSLLHSSGMSDEGRMMKLTEIPEFILWGMRAISRTYWDTKKRIYDFIRRYPGFMVGDHSNKQHGGLIIK